VLNNAAFNNGHQGLTAHEIRDAAYSGNLVYGNGFSSSEEGEGIMIWRSENVLVSANTVHNNHGFGIRIWEGLVDGGSAPVVENNLLYQNQGGGLKISGTVEDGRVYNNTIVFNTNTGLQLGDMISGFEILNTILAGNQPQLEYDGGAWFDYNLYNPDVLFPDKGEHSITGDPLFISVEEQDFHLQPDSPAVDSGNLLLSVSSDIEGTARPLGAGYDIGAYESTAAGAIFQDVPPGCYGYDEIEALYRAGYIAGCSAEPRLFCPDNTMTRAESAVFVERGLHGAAFDPPDPEVVVFADVALEAWYADWVDGLWLDDFTAGCSTDPLLYCPLAEHTRAEGSVFFLRLLMGKDYKPALVEGLFADVPLEEWYAPWMEEAYRQGLLDPCLEEPEMRICPEEPLSRAEAAVIMARAQGLVGQ
ncbi:MAG: right-handed parallel beta-helix repeat-containing protein, partial [Anaerolineales bacterium]|nr:right-handed parallel beta-helix repeat-containing protein [Anaerolineales bacterium]